eukprot:7120714-Prymnesium_polylepis.1
MERCRGRGEEVGTLVASACRNAALGCSAYTWTLYSSAHVSKPNLGRGTRHDNGHASPTRTHVLHTQWPMADDVARG